MKKKHSTRQPKFADVEHLNQRITKECPPKGTYYYKVPKEPNPENPIPVKFEDLPISHTITKALKECKYNIMTDIQRCVITHALSHRDILACSRTGSGKTLAYIVPVIENLYREKWTEFDGLGALIIVPTRELAIQIFRVFEQVCVGQQLTVSYAIGGTSVEKEKFIMSHVNIMICTPGRLLQHITETFNFNCDNLKMLVLDEMDRILDLGFEATIRQILKYIPKTAHKMLFSATLCKSIKSLASLNLSSPEYISLHGYKEIESLQPIESEALEQNAKPKSVAPLRLQQFYMLVKLQDKVNTLFAFIKAHKHQKCIVFLSSCKQVRYFYEAFKRLELAVPFLELHGRQKQGKRTAIFMEFTERKKSYLLATDIASRGIDFPSVDWVIQMDCPEDVDTYIHRIGRTARYRAKGNSLLFLDPSEGAFINQLSEKNLAPKQLHTKQAEDISSKLSALLSEKPEIKYLAEKAFTSYAKSIHLVSNKAVFNPKNYEFQGFSYSLGLASEVSIKIDENSSEDETDKVITKSKLQKFKEKIKMKKLLNQNKEPDQNEDFLIKKDKPTEISDEPIPVRVSKNQLKRIKPEGVQKGANITAFDDEGNVVKKESVIDELRKNAKDVEETKEDEHISKIKKTLENDEEESKEWNSLLKERKRKKKLKKKAKIIKDGE